MTQQTEGNTYFKPQLGTRKAGLWDLKSVSGLSGNKGLEWEREQARPSVFPVRGQGTTDACDLSLS